MADPIRISVEDVARYFEGLEDPRSDINQRHPLVSVVVLSLMAVLAGAGGPTAIAAWANDKKDFLLPLLPLPHGIPQKDVYRRVLSALKRIFLGSICGSLLSTGSYRFCGQYCVYTNVSSNCDY